MGALADFGLADGWAAGAVADVRDELAKHAMNVFAWDRELMPARRDRVVIMVDMLDVRIPAILRMTSEIARMHFCNCSLGGNP